MKEQSDEKRDPIGLKSDLESPKETATKPRRALRRLRIGAYVSPAIVSFVGRAVAQGPGDPLGGIDVSEVPVLSPAGAVLLGGGLAAVAMARKKMRSKNDDEPKEP